MTERGLYGKYRVEKISGKPIGQCFVLEEHDPFAWVALYAYAQACRDKFPALASDLITMGANWRDAHEGLVNRLHVKKGCDEGNELASR